MEEEIFKIFNKVTTTISIISSTLTSIFGIEWAEHNQWKGAKSDDKTCWKYSYGESDDYVLFGDYQICFQTYADLYNLEPDTQKIARAREVENSNKGLLGILKKVCYWVLIGISFLISYLLMQLGSKLNINLEFIILFGWFTLACLIINESRSIIENLIEIGIDVPIFLKKGLETYENIINSTIEKLNNKK